MAARRLLIIMFLLLGISTLAAALVPPPQEQEETSTSTTTSSTEATTGNGRAKGSDLVRAEVAIGRSGARPREVDVEPGDQLALVVTSGDPGEVSVPDFGLIEFAGPGNTASFDILVEERGRFPLRFQRRGTVATIVAEPAEKKPNQS